MIRIKRKQIFLTSPIKTPRKSIYCYIYLYILVVCCGHVIKTPVTNKYLAVVVKINEIENFIITAYFTDRIKKGELIWEKN